MKKSKRWLALVLLGASSVLSGCDITDPTEDFKLILDLEFDEVIFDGSLTGAADAPQTLFSESRFAPSPPAPPAIELHGESLLGLLAADLGPIDQDLIL